MAPLDAALAALRSSFDQVAPLPDDVWADLRDVWRLRPVRAGEVLTRAGDVERRFAQVAEGVQRGYFLTPDAAEVTIAFAYPADFTGVPDSFFLQTPSAYTLEAMTDGAQLETDHSTFAALVDRHRALEHWVSRLLALALAGRGKREREMLSLSAEARYARLVRESPHLLDLVPLRHVASYLGMTPETLSRVRARRS
ncbi:Crp/Fnr family transcriptional regulator [Rubrivirga sp. IMCC43871]|uniref:Crp/Fnr family transcriptional regulator n=1 Tax=Rubrivirga sp. IMCC43871 TaxID=3391575 RepID=UPI0039900AF0